MRKSPTAAGRSCAARGTWGWHRRACMTRRSCSRPWWIQRCSAPSATSYRPPRPAPWARSPENGGSPPFLANGGCPLYPPRVIYLIDASVYVFRAYYSMPPDMTDRDGNPAHATFGFARFLGDLIERVKPQYMAVAFDESLTTSFRNQIYPAYKANRDPPPADLKAQFASCREFCRHAGIPAFGHVLYEADDIVGTLMLRCRRAGLP